MKLPSLHSSSTSLLLSNHPSHYNNTKMTISINPNPETTRKSLLSRKKKKKKSPTSSSSPGRKEPPTHINVTVMPRSTEGIRGGPARKERAKLLVYTAFYCSNDIIEKSSLAVHGSRVPCICSCCAAMPPRRAAAAAGSRERDITAPCRRRLSLPHDLAGSGLGPYRNNIAGG